MEYMKSGGAPGKVVDLIEDPHQGTTCAMHSDCGRPKNILKWPQLSKQGDGMAHHCPMSTLILSESLSTFD